jgi:hypothetical protein
LLDENALARHAPIEQDYQMGQRFVHAGAALAAGEHNVSNQAAPVQPGGNVRGLGMPRAKDKSQVGLPGWGF